MLALAFSGHAYADRVADNLKGLSFDDICAFTAMVSIDNAKSVADEERLKRIILEQDALFDIGFRNIKVNPACSQGIYISFEVLKTKSGSHIYAYVLDVFSFTATANKFLGTMNVKGATYYNVAGYGIDTDIDSMRKTMDTITKEVFQNLALDWRMSH